MGMRTSIRPESRVLVVLAMMISGLAGLGTVVAGWVVVGGVVVGLAVVVVGWEVVVVAVGVEQPTVSANAASAVRRNSHFFRIKNTQ